MDIEGCGGVGGADDGGEDVGALSNNSAFGSIDMILVILFLLLVDYLNYNEWKRGREKELKMSISYVYSNAYSICTINKTYLPYYIPLIYRDCYGVGVLPKD